MPLGIDFFMNFRPKMEAKDPLEDIIFGREQFYRFLKDVLNKTLTFEVRRHPKMETENYKKAFKFSFVKKSKNLSKYGPKRSQKGPQKRNKID